MNKIIIKTYHFIKNIFFKGSGNYWEKRYVNKGNSGSGSYGELALFKAKIINEFIKKNKINSIIEFGCGDGNQLNLIKCKKYVGLDVSKTIIKTCINKFCNDHKKSFFLYDSSCFKDNSNIFLCDLSLSLDVLYHLIEKDVFEKYLVDLFNSSNKYVIIYSSNFNSKQQGHVKHRNITGWIEKNIENFKLIKKINNKFKYDESNPNNTSLADVYIYEKRN
jgi:hypothetical protein